MKRLLLAGASAWAIFALPALASDLDPALIADHVKVLASDDFEGRGPATEGEVKTVKYMADQFKAVGLQPGGDLMKDGKRAWTQDVPLAQFDNKGAVTATVSLAIATTSGQMPCATGIGSSALPVCKKRSVGHVLPPSVEIRRPSPRSSSVGRPAFVRRPPCASKLKTT